MVNYFYSIYISVYRQCNHLKCTRKERRIFSKHYSINTIIAPLHIRVCKGTEHFFPNWHLNIFRGNSLLTIPFQNVNLLPETRRYEEYFFKLICVQFHKRRYFNKESLLSKNQVHSQTCNNLIKKLKAVKVSLVFIQCCFLLFLQRGPCRSFHNNKSPQGVNEIFDRLKNLLWHVFAWKPSFLVKKRA